MYSVFVENTFITDIAMLLRKSWPLFWFCLPFKMITTVVLIHPTQYYLIVGSNGMTLNICDCSFYKISLFTRQRKNLCFWKLFS